MFRSFVLNARSFRHVAQRSSRPFSSQFTERAQSWYARNRTMIPVYGAVVGSCGLYFNTNILFPWHVELSDQFKEVEDQVERTVERNREHAEILRRILEHENAIKTKERKILDHEEEIISIEKDILLKIELLEKELDVSAQVEKQ